MCIELSEAKREDLLELSRGLWKSYESPFQGFIRLIAPIIDDDREGSLRHFARRQIEETKAEPDTIWLKAVDSDTGQIVGGAKWVFLRTEYNRGTSSPNERHRLFEATWYPAGVARTFATEAMVHLHYKRIFTQAARQHAC